jgi:hypothetical protein
MAKVITFSRTFPVYHPKAGKPTYFVEKYLNSNNFDYLSNDYQNLLININPKIDPEIIMQFIRGLASGITNEKHTTIRARKRLKNGELAERRFKKGDLFSPRVWGTDINPKSGKSGPYHSKQIILAPDTEILEVWDITINECKLVHIAGSEKILSQKKEEILANNDGLNVQDFFDWFPKPFIGQIICWNENVKY